MNAPPAGPSAFADPGQARDELDLADQLLTGLGLRADIDDRARLLHTDIRNSSLTSAQATLELVLVFHHAVRGDDTALTTVITRPQTPAPATARTTPTPHTSWQTARSPNPPPPAGSTPPTPYGTGGAPS